jgi:TolB protein
MKFLLFFLLFTSSALLAQTDQGLTVVAIGDAEAEHENISIVVSANADKKLIEIAEIVKNDFSFYKKFFLPQVVNESKTVGAGVITISGSSEKVEAEASYKGESEKRTFEIQGEQLRSTAHSIAAFAYKVFKKSEPIFTKKIVFVSDIASKGSEQFKELYVMDFDGQNAEKLTNHRGIVISPAFSFSGEKVIYSLIRSEKSRNRNIDLYEIDLKSKKSRLISNFNGINSGAVYLPGDREILLTLSFGGNAEIYKMDLESKKLFKITNNPAPDVDPDLRPDGSMLTFLSGRPGKAMIYTMDPSVEEKDVKRISFVGEFNATPRFSPDGRMIVFSSWLDNRFDIFRINSDGSGLYRLTKDFGSNEDPSFSPDAEFIIFSSQRVISQTQATQSVFIMDKDGEIIGPLTKGFGNCISPRWSK